MGPKKQKGRASGDSKKSSSSSSRIRKGAAQVQLSSENEHRLRRLLQNTGGPSSAPTGNSQECLTELQKKQAIKRLHNIYATLAHEGFTSSQIELALQALPVGEVTLEAVLDWLCLNLSGNELPRKFSSGVVTAAIEGGSVQLLAAARPEQPLSSASDKTEVEQTKGNVLVSQRQETEESEKDIKDEQANWIRRYMTLQEEEDDDADRQICETDSDSDWEKWGDPSEGQHRKEARSKEDPSTRACSIVAEFQAAKQAAANAKGKGDKHKQAIVGRFIRGLKLEMASLGITDDACQKTSDSPFTRETVNNEEMCLHLSQVTTGDQVEKKNISEGPKMSCSIQKDGPGPIEEKNEKEVTEEDGDILGLFDEDAQTNKSLPESIVEFQRKEKAMIWVAGADQIDKRQVTKKGTKDDSQRMPKAVLQQQCQKNDWESPKYSKVSGQVNIFSYTVTIVRPSTGRGKNKKVGGPMTYNFPELESGFKSIEEAQNAVATRALFLLFPELPLYRILPEPYRSMCLGWHTQGERTERDTDIESARRSNFVKSLMNVGIIQDEDSTIYSQVEPEETCKSITISQGDLNGHNRHTQHEEKLNSWREVESCSLLHKFEEKKKRPEYKLMSQSRAALPIAAVKEHLLEQVMNNEVLVVSGETGCGKTTQVPQYVLEKMINAKCGGFCNIICTQPRRIAAISVAERVAKEQCDSAPGIGESLVGYQVRLDSSWNSRTKLLFCTTGILLRRLAGDRDLIGVSHIIVDEVHERSVLGDFTLMILKDLLERRQANGIPTLKVILMSATVDAQMFSRYFGNCPVVTVEGRTFPVRTMYLEDVYEIANYRLASDSPAAITNSYKAVGKKKAAQGLVGGSRGRWNLVQSGWGDEDMLEEELYNPLFEESLYEGYSERAKKNLAKINEDVIDYDLLEDLIKHIDEVGEKGAILVFLPGMAEIQQLLDRLTTSKQFSGTASQWLLPLHSSIAISDQQKAFQSPPYNVRKIVVATNIAETSITIDDVVHVVDCGKHKEIRYDAQRGMSSMVEAWISQANAKQRRGRAGRVKPGNCFCLYTRHRFENLMRPFQVPEILRVPLVELCLQIKFLSLGSVASFLEKALEPPKEDAVRSAISTLREVGALDEKEELTALGYHLAKLPVDVRIGKIMLYGAVFGCLSPVLTIAACLSYKPPFSTQRDLADAVKRAKQALVDDKANNINRPNIARGQQSDHLAMVAAYNYWITVLRQQGAKAAREHCKSNFINGPTMSMLRDMRIQFAMLLADIGFIDLSQVDNTKIDQLIDDSQKPFNHNARFASIVKAALCAGLYPNVAAMDEESIQTGHASALSRRAGLASAERAHWFDGRREVFIHPSSVNHNTSEFCQPFLVFHEKVETSKVYLRDTTVVSPYALLLFGGTIALQHQTGSITVDGWLKMKAPAQTAVLFKELRIALNSVLKELLKRPQGRVSTSAKEVVPSIVQLLIEEERSQS